MKEIRETRFADNKISPAMEVRSRARRKPPRLDIIIRFHASPDRNVRHARPLIL